MIYINNGKIKWVVTLHRQVQKTLEDLPEPVRARLAIFVRELEDSGPVRGNWKNYGKLGRDRHHCHLKTGRPTYVACWEVCDSERKIMEVYYVGTHEKAPY